MPRRPRFQEPGAIYYVTSRGTEGRPVFLDDLDRRLFISVLAEVVQPRVGLSLLLPDDEPLSSAGPDSASRPRRRDASTEQRPRELLQPPTRPPRASVSEPLLGASDRERVAPPRGLPLHRPQP